MGTEAGDVRGVGLGPGPGGENTVRVFHFRFQPDDEAPKPRLVAVSADPWLGKPVGRSAGRTGSASASYIQAQNPPTQVQQWQDSRVCLDPWLASQGPSNQPL